LDQEAEPRFTRDRQGRRRVEGDCRSDTRTAVDQPSFPEHLAVDHDPQVELVPGSGNVDADPPTAADEELGREIALEEEVLTRRREPLLDDAGDGCDDRRVQASEELVPLESGHDLLLVHGGSVASGQVKLQLRESRRSGRERGAPMLHPRPGGRRVLLGPWRRMLMVYEYRPDEDRVVVVTIQDARSSSAATGG
jgi:hypothetical protein